MIEIYPNLFVGAQTAYDNKVKYESGWRVVHACKEPFHREALGYTGRAAPSTHPEYLLARRKDRLILNLVDVDNPAYIRHEIIDEALKFIHDSLQEGFRVLVHCNQGESRSPSIGLLYLAAHTDHLKCESLQTAETEYRRIYPSYNPAGGMRGFLLQNWRRYIHSA